MTGKLTKKDLDYVMKYKPDARALNRGLTIGVGGPSRSPNAGPVAQRPHQGRLPHQYPWIDSTTEDEPK